MAATPEYLNMQELPLRIGEGFGNEDSEVIKTTLTHLLPHFRGDYCLSGGTATQAHLVSAEYTVANRRLNDLDIIMRSLTDISPTITRDFLIAHWHPYVATDGFYAALVDRHTGLHTDVFGWERFPPDPILAHLNEQRIPIRSAADQSIVLLSALHDKMAHGIPLIRKQFTDVRALMSIANPLAAERLWRALHQDSTFTAREAWQEVQDYAALHQDYFIEKPHHGAPGDSCAECVPTEGYPIASPKAVAAALGARSK